MGHKRKRERVQLQNESKESLNQNKEGRWPYSRISKWHQVITIEYFWFLRGRFAQRKQIVIDLIETIGARSK